MRLKSRLIGCLSALALCVGLGLMAAPWSALATESCANVTGSGSSLQAEQQLTWTKMVETVGLPLGSGSAECSAKPKITYMATGSGKGLSEFGNNATETLKPTESGNGSTLDAYVGSDDPPTLTELGKIEKAGGTKALVIPTVAAPIAVIVHPPAECDVLGGSLGFPILNRILSTTFSKLLTWSAFLLAVEKHQLEAKVSAITFKETGKCLNHILIEVRSDSSGTSFAFKQYLCQIEPEVWLEKPGSAEECNSPNGLVVDNPTWPSGPIIDKEHGSKVLNEGNKGVISAVGETEGSIGYAVTAGAAGAKFAPYGETAGHSLLLFWATVQNKVEPATGEKANCPTNTELSPEQKAEAKADMWGKIHLANPEQSGAYPICTLTYDIGWENYKTTNLEKEYGTGKGTEVGNTASNYFLYMVKASQGQTEIAPYYSALSAGTSGIHQVAEELAKTVG